MRKFLWRSWFRDVSIARKLYFTVGIMAVLIGVELFALSFSMNALSSVRAYVGGEGLWSKAQKDAIYALQSYGRTRNEEDYKHFKEFMTVPLGDGKARAEMMKPVPDMDAARKGFIEGRNHEKDVNGMINLFRRFYFISYINKAIVIWGEAEPYAIELIKTADAMHAEINSAHPSEEKIQAQLAAIPEINRKLTVLEDDFSFTLGQGARWLEKLVLNLLFCIALTVELTGIILAISVSRTIQKGLAEIIKAAKEFTGGNLKARSKVFSDDEIGVLATSFNDMSGIMESNIKELEDAQVRQKDLYETLQQSEAEVRALNDSLEKKVAQRTEQLEEANRRMEFFSYSVSHDLRTPLRSINGFSKILTQKYSQQLDKDAKEYLDLISANANRMNRLIEGLLELARSDRSVLSKTHVEMNMMVHDLVKEIKAIDKDIKTEIKIDALAAADCDPVLIKQVWANLISNAIKYSHKKDKPVVEIGMLTESDRIVYYVKDNGAGFDMQQAGRLFSAFNRLHAQEDFEGTGVGLALVQRIVNRHDGKIWAEAEVNKGAAFYFSLWN